MSTSWPIRSLQTSPPGVVKPTVRWPRNRWSYSTPTTSSARTRVQTGTDRSAPAGFTCRSQQRARAGRAGGGIDVVPVSDHGAAALHVEQHAVPGVTNLTSDEAEGVDTRTVAITRDQGGAREECAHIVAPEIGPVALTFKTEHPIGRLPAIADLAADVPPVALWQPSPASTRSPTSRSPSICGSSRHRR